MLKLHIDDKMGGIPRYRLMRQDEPIMYVPDEIRKCVVFIFCYDEQRREVALGTGFLVLVQNQDWKRGFDYLVTAKHVLVAAQEKYKAEAVTVRVNRVQGDYIDVECPIDQWEYHDEDTSVDAAVIPWSHIPGIDVKLIVYHYAVDQDIIRDEGIGIGDELFLTGVFVAHRGKARTLPIVRVGNIARMPEEKIPTKHFGDIEAYLVEVRSIGGLSGSPVFVHLGQARMVKDSFVPGRPRFYWLGLMHGHYYREIPDEGADHIMMNASESHEWNMGIAIVVPATKVLEILNKPLFADLRQKLLKQLDEEALPKEDGD